MKSAYLGSGWELTFDTALGPVFVISGDPDRVPAAGADVGLSLAGRGVCVLQAS